MRKNYDFCQKHRTISFLNKKIIIFAVHNKMQITLKGKKTIYHLGINPCLRESYNFNH